MVAKVKCAIRLFRGEARGICCFECSEQNKPEIVHYSYHIVWEATFYKMIVFSHVHVIRSHKNCGQTKTKPTDFAKENFTKVKE